MLKNVKIKSSTGFEHSKPTPLLATYQPIIVCMDCNQSFLTTNPPGVVPGGCRVSVTLYLIENEQPYGLGMFDKVWCGFQ
jgi:hypothetical protein